MKETPEKIYMKPSFWEPENVSIAYFSKNPKDFHYSIEYTRTDAIVKKAEEYLKEHLIDYWAQRVTDEREFIEDFRKYIKGE